MSINSDPFNFYDLLGKLGGNQSSIKNDFAKIAENNRIKVLEEENSRLKEENQRLRDTILKCPGCGTKLRLPRK